MGIKDNIKNKIRTWNEKNTVKNIVANAMYNSLKNALVDYYMQNLVTTPVVYYYPNPEYIKWKIQHIERSQNNANVYFATVKVSLPTHIETHTHFKNSNRLILGTDLTIDYTVVLGVNITTKKIKIVKYVDINDYIEGRTYIELRNAKNEVIWERTWQDWYNAGYDDVICPC
ncbi:hypothetical protein APY94_00150 [Thermococcus celericrescens]|uniref:Uncharacterized protein n=1 Tax=Thermococcus celericrescens TaxID=227598 RepID=A0A124EBP6_9EURY|nr:hypothetical protein [Thermococcus celericrescens]KUH34822.1 hypothetical protein APY94_00150 [Thermococcus celericrescens]